MGQNMGHLISKSGGKYRDIDIKIMTVSRCQHIACTAQIFLNNSLQTMQRGPLQVVLGKASGVCPLVVVGILLLHVDPEQLGVYSI